MQQIKQKALDLKNFVDEWHYICFFKILMRIKNIHLFLIMAVISLMASCVKDNPLLDPNPVTQKINFVGQWNRDSVLQNEVPSTGPKIRVESLVNDGKFSFNPDTVSGILTQGSNNYAITWVYGPDYSRITISEPDWINQTYLIEKLGNNNLILTGIKQISGVKNERILYLRRL